MGVDTSYTGIAIEEFDVGNHSSNSRRHDFRSSHGKGREARWRPPPWTIHINKQKFRRRLRKVRGEFHHFLSILLIFGLIVAIILLVKLPLFAHSGSICLVDGEFNLGFESPVDYNPWATSETFTINLASGPIPFAKAKLADVFWDVGVGRGVQSLLAIVSYKVCTKALSRTMQAEPVSHRTFEAIALRGNSLSAVILLAKDFTKNGSFRARMTIFWITMSAILLLAFPTLASAMTGYSATLDSYIQPNNSEAVEAENFKNVFYVIHDGSRLGSGYYDDYPVVDPRQGDPVIPNFCDIYNVFDAGSFQTKNATVRQRYMPGCASYAPEYNSPAEKQSWQQSLSKNQYCDMLWHMSEYTSKYGFLGLQNISSTLDLSTGNITLSSPVLNITAYYSDDSNGVCFSDYLESSFNTTLDDWRLFPFGITWHNTVTNTTVNETPFSTSNPIFAYNRTMYTLDQMNSQGKCQQRGPLTGPISYQWGFSFQLLLACLILLLVWSVGMYILHIDAYMNIHSAIEKRELGLQRAILDLANEYNTKLSPTSNGTSSPCNIQMYNNEKLQHLIGKEHAFSYEVAAYEHGPSRAARFKSWFRQGGKKKIFSRVWFRREPFWSWLHTERYWLLSLWMLFLLAVFSRFIGAIMYVWSPDGSYLPVLGNIFALAAARRRKVRGWIMALFFTIFLAVEIWWAYSRWQCVVEVAWIWGFVPASDYGSQIAECS